VLVHNLLATMRGQPASSFKRYDGYASCPLHIHRDAQPAYDHEAFDDGAEWDLGALRVRALHTPEHRPGELLLPAPRRCAPASGECRRRR
jgi:hydroxyacylglutathione hydrolase